MGLILKTFLALAIFGSSCFATPEMIKLVTYKKLASPIEDTNLSAPDNNYQQPKKASKKEACRERNKQKKKERVKFLPDVDKMMMTQKEINSRTKKINSSL